MVEKEKEEETKRPPTESSDTADGESDSPSSNDSSHDSGSPIPSESEEEESTSVKNTPVKKKINSPVKKPPAEGAPKPTSAKNTPVKKKVNLPAKKPPTQEAPKPSTKEVPTVPSKADDEKQPSEEVSESAGLQSVLGDFFRTLQEGISKAICAAVNQAVKRLEAKEKAAEKAKKSLPRLDPYDTSIMDLSQKEGRSMWWHMRKVPEDWTRCSVTVAIAEKVLDLFKDKALSYLLDMILKYSQT